MIISDLLQLAWFNSGEQSAGIVFSNLFNPISLETLALLFTLVSFVSYISSYHLNSILDWVLPEGVVEQPEGSWYIVREDCQGCLWSSPCWPQEMEWPECSGYSKHTHQALYACEASNITYHLLSCMLIRISRWNSGVVDKNAPAAQLTGEAEDWACDELAGRTGETDSEVSDEE